jgi:hypothetical protein
MSWVTTLMLHVSALENVEALTPMVNAFFESYPHSVDGTQQSDAGLAPISQVVPGGKVFGARVFVGAYNYFPVEKFIAHLRSIEWEAPEFIQLFVMDEEDLSFRVVQIGNS